ncbi:hypothetical protein BV902_20795 [Sphingobacterium sp. B29]|uniref:hypothetical protein n=1 Tax=Sphingobacterium sp. B29 TaxID=1933220 RepID=UPI0009586152|nr:hypothetical protein [Sphingobacterium sp. B29]APU98475.1 hypothetical protein BV902_20795 [Sphingobacterium sp. B29]
MGNDKSEKYELAYALLNDSLEREKAHVMDIAINQILKFKDREANTKVSKAAINTIASLLLLVAVSFFVWRSKHNKQILVQKEEALQETETINKELPEQIGENKFNTLIDLAKNNNPEFLILFTELYPQFIQALTSFDANLRNTELEFVPWPFSTLLLKIFRNIPL